MVDELLGFCDPRKICTFSLEAHELLVEQKKLEAKDLPVFSYRRMTGEDVLLLQDSAYEEETNKQTGNITTKSLLGRVKLQMIRKYWVGASAFIVEGRDLSFTAEQMDSLAPNAKNSFIDERLNSLDGTCIELMFYKIRFGSSLSEMLAKNSGSLASASSDMTPNDSLAKVSAGS